MNGRIGFEATGHTRWFERLVSELVWELWIGDAAQIAAMRVWKQKTDLRGRSFIARIDANSLFPEVTLKITRV